MGDGRSHPWCLRLRVMCLVARVDRLPAFAHVPVRGGGAGGEALRRLWQEGRSDERVRVWEEEHVAAWRRALMTMARQHRQMAAG